MPKAILLKVDGTSEEVVINESEPFESKAELDLIGSTDSYLTILVDSTLEVVNGKDTNREIFLFCDACNDFGDGQMKPLNTFISRYSKATIFGDALVYLLETKYNGPSMFSDIEEKRVDLLLTPEELGFILESLDTRKRGEDIFDRPYLSIRDRWQPEPKTKLRTISDDFPVMDVEDVTQYEFLSCIREDLVEDLDFRERFIKVLAKTGMNCDYWGSPSEEKE